MKTEEKLHDNKVENVIVNRSSDQQEKILFPEKLALAKKQLKGVKLPSNKNLKK